MMRFLHGDSSRNTPEQYREDFRQMANWMWLQEEVDATGHDQLIHAMAVLQNELMEQGCMNWDRDDQGFYLDLVRKRLLAWEGLPADARRKVEKACDTILRRGTQMEEVGKSSVRVDAEVDYLVARVVDWCNGNPCP